MRKEKNKLNGNDKSTTDDASNNNGESIKLIRLQNETMFRNINSSKRNETKRHTTWLSSRRGFIYIFVLFCFALFSYSFSFFFPHSTHTYIYIYIKRERALSLEIAVRHQQYNSISIRTMHLHLLFGLQIVAIILYYHKNKTN